MQSFRELRDALWRLSDSKIAEVPDFVFGCDNGVPAIDHRLIHLGD